VYARCEGGRHRFARPVAQSPCPHPWHVNFKLKGGEPLRKSVDKLFEQLPENFRQTIIDPPGKHIASKEDAQRFSTSFGPIFVMAS
jgi:hypothetical protein